MNVTVYFIDTSALGKRYVAEVGSVWLTQQVQRLSGNIVVISDLTAVEMFSVFARRQRENSLSASDAARQRADFLLHIEQEYLSFPLDAPVLVRARDLVTRYSLRTLDSLQLACAKEAAITLNEPITFVSADRNLLSIATAEGFTTDDPNAHP